MDEENEDEDWNQAIDDVRRSRTFIQDSDEDWTQPLQKDNKQDTGKQEMRMSKVDTGKYASNSVHPRTILHLDVDCFYAQVEMLRNPELRDKPLGIQQKFIVVTCNYKAREYGVTKLMTIKDAKEKCPQLILVSGEDLTKYREMSYRISEFLQKYTPYIERLGFDENFLDISTLVDQRISSDSYDDDVIGHVCSSAKSSEDRDQSDVCGCGCSRRITIGTQVAADIRQAVHNQLGITCCGGISYNKLLAKLVGEQHKPNQQTCLFPGEVQDFMTGLAKVRKIPGIGSATYKKLQALGIHSVTDLQNYPLSDLKLELGETQAIHIHKLSYGIDEEMVHTYGKPQTISDEDSYNFKKCCTVEDARGKIRGLLTNLLIRLEEDGRLAQTIRLSVCRIIGGKFGRRESRQCPLPSYVMGKLSSKREEVLDKLQDLVMSLLNKLVDLTKPFQIALMNIAFCNFQEKSRNSISNFFSPKKKSLSPQYDEKEKADSVYQNVSSIGKQSSAPAENDKGVDTQRNNKGAYGLKRKSDLDEETSHSKRVKAMATSTVQSSSWKMSSQTSPVLNICRPDNDTSPRSKATRSEIHTQTNTGIKVNKSVVSNDIDLSVLAQLPPDIRAEILPQLTEEQRAFLSDESREFSDKTEGAESGILQNSITSDSAASVAIKKASDISNFQGSEANKKSDFKSGISVWLKSPDCSTRESEKILSRGAVQRHKKEHYDISSTLGTEDNSAIDSQSSLHHSPTRECSSESVEQVSSPSCHDGLPSAIDREIFDSLPSDIQREILSEHKHLQSTSDLKHLIPKNDRKHSGKGKGKGKPSDGNILNFFKKTTCK